MTRRQLEVLAAVSGGANDEVVARDLGITRRTIRTSLSAAADRLEIPTGRPGVSRRDEILVRARPWLSLVREPLRDPDPPLSAVHLAYAHCWDRLACERTPTARATLSAAFVMLAGETDLGTPERWGTAGRPRPDVDELLLRLARGARRPV